MTVASLASTSVANESFAFILDLLKDPVIHYQTILHKLVDQGEKILSCKRVPLRIEVQLPLLPKVPIIHSYQLNLHHHNLCVPVHNYQSTSLTRGVASYISAHHYHI